MTEIRRGLAVVLAFAFCLAAAANVMAGPTDDIKAGNKAAMAGKYKQAMALFSKAIDSKGLSKRNRAVAYNNRGSARDDSGDTDGAVRDFNRAIKTDPDYAEAYYNRSFAYEKKGLFRLAVGDIEKALRLVPDDMDYQMRLEYLNSKLGGGG